MKIEIDVNLPLTAVEKSILRKLLGEDASEVAKETPKKAKEEPEEKVSDDPSEVTVESVAAKAAKLITDGERDKVKDALEDVGAKRIRELTEEQAIKMDGLLS